MVAMVAQVQSLEDLISSLLDCASTYSTCDSIKNEVSDSIRTIGGHQPNTLLTACHHYLLQNPKLAPNCKTFVLQSIDAVVSEGKIIGVLDEQLVLLIINLATQEMTMTKTEADSEWSDTARDVLVTLAKSHRFVSHVLDAVLLKFPPGLTVSPHRYVVLTLATVAQHNPFGLVPFLTDILSRTVPLLQYVKTDPLRSAWARAICAFCEAVRECETERPKEAGEEEHDGENSRHFTEPDVEHHVLSNRGNYADQAEAIYEVVFQWMYSKDPKTRAEAAECVGELCLMIRPAKIVEDLMKKKLISTMLKLYQKAYTDHHLITMGVCRFLEATCMDDTCPLDGYMEEILNALFPNACIDPDDAGSSPNANAMKNHSEAFRCFHVAASRFADKIVYYLLHKMQNVADSQKLGAINVLRHLLNSAGPYMEDKRSLVMMGLRKLLAVEHAASIRVKRAIVQLCVALADHAYVDAEGGDHVIAFLVRNLVPPTELEMQTRKIEVDIAGSNQLRTQCAQALHTIASTCVCANKLLWPYLFEFICAERYTPVVGDICKCLRTLVAREEEEGRQPDFETGFDNPRVAGRHAVLARLFVCLCNAPLNGLLARRARESGALMRCIGSWFHPALSDVFDRWVDRMEPLIDELSTGASVSTPTGENPPAVELRGRRIARWHDACLDMLSACLTSVNDGDWRMELAAAMAKQLDMYKEMADEKAFLLRCLGTALAKIALKSFVVDHLMLMFKSTLHSSATERQGCARGVGACASVHTDLVLVELENVSKWEHAKKSTGIFGFIKDAMPMRQYTDTDMVFLRATLMLSYGYVVMACNIDTVTQRLQQTVIVFLRHYFANTKQETVVREAMLETMRLIAMAVHPSRLGNDFKLDTRNELISYIKDYVQSENPEMLSSSLRLLAAKASAALVRLEPALSENDTWDLGRVLTQYTLPMCREKSGLKTFAYDLFDYASSSISSLTQTTSTSSRSSNRKIDDDESATIMDATVSQYGVALEEIVRMRPTTNTVTLLLKMLQPYYGRSADHERSRSIDATVLILKVYFEHADDISIGHANDFGPLSSLLARLTPRLSDSLSLVRTQSLAAIHWALRLAHLHKGHGKDTHDSTLFTTEAFTREFLNSEGKLDGQAAKRATKRMAEVIEYRLPQSQMQTYLSALFEMLTDRQSQVSSSAAQLLTSSLTSRGATLVNEADTLVTALLSRLPEVHSCVQTYTDLQAALVAFAAHQQQIVCDVILRQPLPYTVQLCDAWECLSRDRNLFPHIVDYLLELLTSSLDVPYDVMDTGAGNSVKIVHQEPCQYTAALTEVIKNGDPELALMERVPVLLGALLNMLSSVSDTQFPVMQKENKDGTKQILIITPELRRAADKPAGMAVAALKTLFNRIRGTDIIEDMNQARGWSECYDKELFIGSLTVLVRSLVDHRPEFIEPLARSVMESSTSDKEPLRLTPVIVASALVRRCPDAKGEFNESLLVDCIHLLQKALGDQSLRIRKLSVRGLGELAQCSSADVAERFANMAVEAAMGGLDDLGDRRDTVAMESILALNKLVSRTDDKQLISILPQVLLKIRPCFEKESAPLRAASFSLLGELGGRVGGTSEEFVTHLHTNIVAILLHLNDEDDEVKRMCSSALLRLHSLFNVPTLSSIIERELKDGRLPSSYQTIQKDLAGVLALAFPDRANQYALTCSNYFKSSSSRIRANSALLTGALLGVLTPQLRATISKDLIFSGLVLLLKDQEDTSVRIAAAKSIASLHDFS